MRELIKICNDYKITPNQAYLLYSIREKVNPVDININQEIRSLDDTWLIFNILTNKSKIFLSELDKIDNSKKKNKHAILGINYLDNINTYRELFPKGKLASGAPARSPIPELENKFTQFFTIFPQYDWDTILKATERYTEEYNGSLYMSTSSYFISKQDAQKITVYKLASYCDTVIDGESDGSHKYYDVEVR